MRIMLLALLLSGCDLNERGRTSVQSVTAIPLRMGQEVATCPPEEQGSGEPDVILHAPEGALSIQVFTCNTTAEGADACFEQTRWRTVGREVIVEGCTSGPDAPHTVEVRWIAP